MATPKKRSRPPTPSRAGRIAKPRNAALDTLRGLAILLMIVDHAADILFQIPIATDTMRLLTRLSMPLFCILMGYFLAARRPEINWDRLLQLVFASLIVNVAFFTLYRRLDILASLLVAYALFMLLRKGFLLGLVAPFFFLYDPTSGWFDFPVSVVVCCVAQGAVLRWFGWRVAVGTAVMITAAVMTVTPPTQLVLFFLLPATGLVAAGVARPDWRWEPLQLLGRYPLTSYVTQYYVLIALGTSVD